MIHRNFPIRKTVIFTYEDADDVIRVVLIRRRRAADEFFSLALFERMSEGRNEDVLENLAFDFLRPRVVVENVDEFEEGFSLPLDGIGFGDFGFEKVFEKLELRDEARDESSKKMKKKLQLIRMILYEVENALDEQLWLLPVGKVDRVDILVSALKSLGDENLKEIDGDVGVLRQPSRILLHELVDDVDSLEFDLVEDLRSELRGRHAGKMANRHVH